MADDTKAVEAAAVAAPASDPAPAPAPAAAAASAEAPDGALPQVGAVEPPKTDEAAKDKAEGSSNKDEGKGNNSSGKDSDKGKVEDKDGGKDNGKVKPAGEASASAPDTRPAYIAQNPALATLFEKLPQIVERTGHGEMWGVQLQGFENVPTVNVLIKFLHANDGDVRAAEEQLVKALEWRKSINPLAVAKGRYSTKFAGLGYLTTYAQAQPGDRVFTWNIYGAVKDLNEVFGNLDEFIHWRVALMEMAISELKLNDATEVIPYGGEDSYRMVQVHDYQSVSFFRMNPSVKAATQKTIDIFATAYPELLSQKFFVNVPTVMGWVFSALKVFLSKATIRKFHPITNGSNLAKEFGQLRDQLPQTYGGKAPPLAESARTIELAPPTPEEAKAAKPDDKAGKGKAPEEATPEETKPAEDKAQASAPAAENAEAKAKAEDKAAEAAAA